MRTKVYCRQCSSDQWVDDDTGRYVAHAIAPYATQCASSGTACSTSSLPGWHPLHVCGMFCDGQDGASSQCAQERRRGPPGIVERLAWLSGE